MDGGRLIVVGLLILVGLLIAHCSGASMCFLGV
jgi:hypothetical protein